MEGKTYANIVVAATGSKTALAALDVSLEMCRIYWRVVVMPVDYEGFSFHDCGARSGALIFSEDEWQEKGCEKG